MTDLQFHILVAMSTSYYVMLKDPEASILQWVAKAVVMGSVQIIGYHLMK